MSVMVARTYMGGRDLNLGVPDLEGAVVEKVEYTEDTNDYNTTLTMKTTKDFEFKLIIVQEK